jgi:hypothetical protein
MHQTNQEPTAPQPATRFEKADTPREPIRRGSTCPQCRQARLDYNGMLDLECPNCGYTESGGAGCT